MKIINGTVTEPTRKYVNQDGLFVHEWSPPYRGYFNNHWGLYLFIPMWTPDDKMQLKVPVQGFIRQDEVRMLWRRSLDGPYFQFSCNGWCWYDSLYVHYEVQDLKEKKEGYDTSCPSDAQLDLILKWLIDNRSPCDCGKSQLVQYATPGMTERSDDKWEELSL